MEAIGTADRVAPVARSPLDSARGRRKHRAIYTMQIGPKVSINSTWECLPSPPIMR